MKHLSLFVLFTISIFVLQAQSEEEGLLAKFNASADESEKFNLLRDLGYLYEFSDSTQALSYYRKAFQLAEKASNNEWKSAACLDQGSVYFNFSKYRLALSYYHQSAVHAEQGKHEIRKAKAFTNLANTHFSVYDYDSALFYGLRSYELYIKSGDSALALTSISNLTSYYDDAKLHKECMYWVQKGLELAEKINDPVSKARLCLGGAQNAVAFGDKKLMLKYLQIAEKTALQIEGNYFKSTTYQGLSGIYNDQEEHELGDQFADSALKYLVAEEGGLYAASIYLTKGRAQEGKGNIDLAFEYYKKSQLFASEIDDYSTLAQVYLSLSECSKIKGDFKNALLYHESYAAYRDSVESIDQKILSAKMDAAYQKEQRQNEINSLKSNEEILKLQTENRFYWIVFLGLLLLLALALFFVWRNNAKRNLAITKQQIQINESRIRELEQQAQMVAMDAIIKGEQNERSRVAKDLHDGVGSLLSGVKLSLSAMKGNMIISEEMANAFERSIMQLDNAIAEMRRVAFNMMPEALVKYGLVDATKNFCADINTSNQLKVIFEAINFDVTLDKSKEVIAFRIIQELVNNAIKHSAGTQAIVQLSSSDNWVSLIVEDNGKGLSDGANNVKGMGLESLNNRVQYLKGKMDVRSETGSGLSVLIEFPAS
ncbi:MAG: ATP-binding protein [Flavobacteriales bacterium]